MLTEVGLQPSKLVIKARLPRKQLIAVRPHNLQTLEIVSAVEPATPAQMITIKSLCYRENKGKPVAEDGIERFTHWERDSRLCISEKVPKYSVSYFILHAGYK